MSGEWFTREDEVEDLVLNNSVSTDKPDENVHNGTSLDSDAQANHSTQSLPDMFLVGNESSESIRRPFQSNHNLNSTPDTMKETPKPRRSAFKKRDSTNSANKRVTIKENEEIIERRRVRTQSMPDEISNEGDADRFDDNSTRRITSDPVDFGRININDFIKPFTTSFTSEGGGEFFPSTFKSKFSVTTVEESPKTIPELLEPPTLSSVSEEIKLASNSLNFQSNQDSVSSIIESAESSNTAIGESASSQNLTNSSDSGKPSVSTPIASSAKPDSTFSVDTTANKKPITRDAAPVNTTSSSVDAAKKAATITPNTTTQKTKEERKKEREKKKEEEMLKKYHMEQEAKQKASAKSKCGRWIKHNLKIGEGGYKFVYRGYDRQEALNVAWCEFKAEHVDTKEKRQAMFHETEIMLKMNHPHIVRCFAVFPNWINVEDSNNPIEEKGLVIIQELMGEGTLKSVIRKNFMEGQCILKFPLITRWWHQILDSLRYMHFKMSPPIIHRDLKAENCFVYGLSDEEYLNVKVGDFGLATHVKHSGRKTMLGTLGFMAPEIFDEKYDVQVDIYAFGMLMLEVMTNRTPYDECDSLFQVASKTMTGTGPEVMEKVTDPAVREVIAACIHPLTCFRPDAEELYHYPLFQPKALPVEVEPILDKESDRAEVINRFVKSLELENKNPKFNLRLRFRDKKMLQELGLDDGESLEFDLDIYEAKDQDIPDLIKNLRLEYEDKLSRVFKNPKQTDKKIVSTHLDRLFTSIRLQMQFLVKVLLGRRWSAILAKLVEDEPKEEDEILNNTFKVISEYKTKWAKAKQMLDKEMETYRKQQQQQQQQLSQMEMTGIVTQSTTIINQTISSSNSLSPPDQPELLHQQSQESPTQQIISANKNEAASLPGNFSHSGETPPAGYTLMSAGNHSSVPNASLHSPSVVTGQQPMYNQAVMHQISLHPGSHAAMQQSFSLSSMAQPHANAIPYANYIPNMNAHSLQSGTHLTSMMSLPPTHHFSLQPGIDILGSAPHPHYAMLTHPHPTMMNMDHRMAPNNMVQSAGTPMMQNNLQPVFQTMSNPLPMQVVSIVPPHNISVEEKTANDNENVTYQDQEGTGGMPMPQTVSTEPSYATILQPIGVNTLLSEQSQGQIQQSDASINASNKTERKGKKKLKPKSRYLLQLTDIKSEPLDNPRLTFCLSMPDSSNPGEKTVWKLTFMCNLQDSIEDLSKPLFEALKDQAGKSCCLQEEIYNDLKETLSLVLRSLTIDRSSIKINEDCSFHPVPTSLGLVSNSPQPTSQAPDGGFLCRRSSFDDNDGNNQEECVRPPTSPVLEKGKLFPDGNNCDPTLTRSATSSPELVPTSDCETPISNPATNNLSSVPESEDQTVGGNAAPPSQSASSSLTSKKATPAMTLAANSDHIESPPVLSSSVENKEEMVQVTLTLPASMEDVMRELSKKLQNLNKKSFVLAPTDNSCSNNVYRLLEVPEEHLFIGVPKPQDQGGGFSIIKSCKECSFVVTHERDAKQLEPKIYQVPNTGVCILGPKGIVHHVDRPSIVVPRNGRSMDVHIAELPVSLDDQSLNMDVDDVITLMQTLKNVSQQIAPKFDYHNCQHTDVSTNSDNSQILAPVPPNVGIVPKQSPKSRNEYADHPELDSGHVRSESTPSNESPIFMGPMSAVPTGMKPPPATPVGVPYFNMNSSPDSGGLTSARTFSPPMQYMCSPSSPQQATTTMQYQSMTSGMPQEGIVSPTMATYQQPVGSFPSPIFTSQQMMPQGMIGYQTYNPENGQLTSPSQPVYMYPVSPSGAPMFMTHYIPTSVAEGAFTTDPVRPNIPDYMGAAVGNSADQSQGERVAFPPNETVHQIIQETHVTRRYTVETLPDRAPLTDELDALHNPSPVAITAPSPPSKFTVTSVPSSITSGMNEMTYPQPPPVSPAVNSDPPPKKKMLNNRFVVETLPESRIDDAPTTRTFAPSSTAPPEMAPPPEEEEEDSPAADPPKMIGRFVVSSVSDT